MALSSGRRPCICSARSEHPVRRKGYRDRNWRVPRCRKNGTRAPSSSEHRRRASKAGCLGVNGKRDHDQRVDLNRYQQPGWRSGPPQGFCRYAHRQREETDSSGLSIYPIRAGNPERGLRIQLGSERGEFMIAKHRCGRLVPYRLPSMRGASFFHRAWMEKAVLPAGPCFAPTSSFASASRRRGVG